MTRSYHRPMQPGERFFDSIESGVDPAVMREAGDRAAHVLVRGARQSEDPTIADRLLHLADEEGMETLAEVWAGASADTLAGCLWRLYLLRQWVHADPHGAAEEFAEGRTAQVARVVAGVADPPGPDQLKAMVDTVLRGIAQADFADVLFRGAAFAYVIATGRAHLDRDPRPILLVAEQLEQAAHYELSQGLS